MELERIFLYLCNVSSEIVSIEAIAKKLQDGSRSTVENYIHYLEGKNKIVLLITLIDICDISDWGNTKRCG